MLKHKYNKMRQAITELRAVVKVLNENQSLITEANQFDGKFQEKIFFFLIFKNILLHLYYWSLSNFPLKKSIWIRELLLAFIIFRFNE